jgi:hypothetical protein
VVLRRNTLTGALAPLRGRAGCVNGAGAFGCRRARGMRWEEFWQGPVALAASSDGHNVYVLSDRTSGSAILSFARDRRTGALRQLPGARGCLTSRPGEGCAVVGGLATHGALTSLWTLAIDPSGKTVVVAGSRGISVYRRRPRDGSLTAFSATPTCFSFREKPPCRRIPGADQIFGDLNELDATFAPGGHSVSFTYSGHESNAGQETGLLLTLGRDTGTGALGPLPGLASCITRQPFRPPDVALPPDTTCTGVRETHLVLHPPVFIDGDTAVMATVAFAFPGADVFMLVRERSSGGLFPTGSAGACWGDPPATQSPPPCQTTTDLGWLLAGPALAADRRTVYVASSRPGRSAGQLLSFAVTSNPPRLGAPRAVKWVGRAKNGFWGPDPVALQPRLDGRALLLLSANGPALHRFGIRRDGHVSGRQHSCLGRAPGCRRAHGPFSGLLAQSLDARYVYVLGHGGAAVVRIG